MRFRENLDPKAAQSVKTPCSLFPHVIVSRPVFKGHWLLRILLKEKTLEVRGTRFAGKTYLLGCRGKIFARATFGSPVRIETLEQWRDLRNMHRVPGNKLPYRRTWGLPLQELIASPDLTGVIERLDQSVQNAAREADQTASMIVDRVAWRLGILLLIAFVLGGLLVLCISRLKRS